MIKIANAPCSWEFWNSTWKAKWRGMLRCLMKCRLLATPAPNWEIGRSCPPSQRLKKEIRARNLEMLGAFVSVDFSNPGAHAAGAETAVRTAELLAEVGTAPFIVLADDNGKNPIRTKNAGRILPAQGLSDEQWSVFAAG